MWRDCDIIDEQIVVAPDGLNEDCHVRSRLQEIEAVAANCGE